MAEEAEKRARRRRSTAGAGGLVNITPQLLPGVFSLLEHAEFAAVAQAHRRLSGPAQRWRERELVRLEREIDAFLAAVRVEDRLVAVLEYPAPFLRYFDLDMVMSRAAEGKEQNVNVGPVGNTVVVTNSGALNRKSFMECVVSVIRDQARTVDYSFGGGVPSWPSRVALLRSTQKNAMEQDLLTRLVPAWPIFATKTGYYSTDFTLDRRMLDQFFSSPTYQARQHHIALTQVPGLLSNSSANLWHDRHVYMRQLMGPELFFTPAVSPAHELQRHFPANRVLLLPSPLGIEALTRWSESHPVYG